MFKQGGGVASLDGRVDPERGPRRSAQEKLSSGIGRTSGTTRRLLPTVAPLKLQPGVPGEKALQSAGR